MFLSFHNRESQILDCQIDKKFRIRRDRWTRTWVVARTDLDGDYHAHFQKKKGCHCLINLYNKGVKPNRAEMLDAFKQLGKGSGVQPKDTNLKALFRRYIAKKGVKIHGRKMMSDEWYRLSHELSEELMMEIADNEAQFKTWEAFYVELMNDHNTKQGQDILPVVIPKDKHQELVDAISKRMVKM